GNFAYLSIWAFVISLMPIAGRLLKPLINSFQPLFLIFSTIPSAREMKVANRQLQHKPLYYGRYHNDRGCFKLQLLSFPVTQTRRPNLRCNGGAASPGLNSIWINDIALSFFTGALKTLQKIARTQSRLLGSF